MIGTRNERACAAVDLSLFTRFATVFSAKLVDSPYGIGCSFRMLARGRTRRELHLFLVSTSANRSFVTVFHF